MALKFDDYSFEQTAKVLRKVNPSAARIGDLVAYMKQHAERNISYDYSGTLGFVIFNSKGPVDTLCTAALDAGVLVISLERLYPIKFDRGSY